MPSSGFIFFAHRGAMPILENTKEAFDAAYQNGARWFECDIQVNKSGTPMLFHDETLTRMCGFEKKFCDMRDEDLQGTLVSGQSPIWDFNGLCQWISTHEDVTVNLELKYFGTDTLNYLNAIAAVLESYQNIHQQLIISSFTWELLAQAQNIWHAIPLSILIESNDQSWQQDLTKLQDAQRTFKAISIAINKEAVLDKPEHIDALQKINPCVYVYTVNEKDAINQLRAHGCCGVFSDKTWPES